MTIHVNDNVRIRYGYLNMLSGQESTYFDLNADLFFFEEENQHGEGWNVMGGDWDLEMALAQAHDYAHKTSANI